MKKRPEAKYTIGQMLYLWQEDVYDVIEARTYIKEEYDPAEASDPDSSGLFGPLDSPGWAYLFPGSDLWYPESTLRKLNAREKGK